MTLAQQRAQEQKAERLRKEKLKAALALFKERAGFARAQVKVYDSEKKLVEGKTAEEDKIGGEARLCHLLKFVDVRGEAYLQLITDQESQEAFESFMAEQARWAFEQFSRMPINMLIPLPPGATEPPLHKAAKRVAHRARHWVMEGYRRLASLEEPNGKAKPVRRGYRREVKGWMTRIGLQSQRQAAKHLGVSIDVLKSIMSDKGRARYSDETLEQVLKKIGHERNAGD